MKKYFLAIIFIVAAAGVTHAQTFRAPVNNRPRERMQQRPAPITRQRVDGAIPRGVRGGNPLQLLNPRAPRRYYGTPDDTVTYDENNPSHITGIILYGLRW